MNGRIGPLGAEKCRMVGALKRHGLFLLALLCFPPGAQADSLEVASYAIPDEAVSIASGFSRNSGFALLHGKTSWTSGNRMYPLDLSGSLPASLPPPIHAPGQYATAFIPFGERTGYVIQNGMGNPSSGAVYFFDWATGATTTIVSGEVAHTHALLDSTSRYLYVDSKGFSNSVIYKIDTSTNMVALTAYSSGLYGGRMVLNGDNTKLYVAMHRTHSMYVYRTADMALLSIIALPGDAEYFLDVSPDGGRIAVPFAGYGIVLIDTATDSVQRVIPYVAAQSFDLRFSPDGRLLYLSNGDLISSETGSVVRTFPVSGNFIQLSPDGSTVMFLDTNARRVHLARTGVEELAGQSIAFHRSVNGVEQIYLTNEDGTGETYLTDGAGPRFSPDGTRVVFYRRQAGSDTGNIWVINSDGTSAMQLTMGNMDRSAYWNNDGTKINFASVRTTTYGILWHMNANGTNQEILVPRLSGQTGAAYGVYAPDGRWFLNSMHGTMEGYPNNWQIHRFNADGSGDTLIVAAGYRNLVDDVSPDGSCVLFHSDRTGAAQLYRMAPDGSHPRPLTSVGRNYGGRFNSDGSRIVFISTRNGRLQVFTMNSDGTDQTLLTDGSCADWLRVPQTPGPACGLVAGLEGPSRGHFYTTKDFSQGFTFERWMRLPWNSYNYLIGQLRPATGDVDGDGLDELVVGLATNPSCGGWLAIFDDAEHDHAFIAWRRVRWSAYNSMNGETVPTCGDLDGDGKDEIVIGLGRISGHGGWLYVIDDASAGFAPLRWVRVPWQRYNIDGGGTRPACGDIDGDGFDEIVIGLDSFPGCGGWLCTLDDARANFRRLSWLRIPWSRYNTMNGCSRPACGDFDRDGRDEITVGLGTGSNGWLPVFWCRDGSQPEVQWIQNPWPVYNAWDGETRPACGDVDGDGIAELVLGLAGGPITNGSFCVLDVSREGASLLEWLRVPWTGYNQVNGGTWPALGHLR